MSGSLRPRARGLRAAALGVSALVAFAGACAPPSSGSTSPVVIYDSNPSPLPPNVPSFGYEATSTSELGDQVTFNLAPRNLQSATVTMSAWALHSEWPTVGDATGWDHPLTLNLRAVGPDDAAGNPTLGTLLGSKTTLFHIPWRPEADPTCATPTAWRDPVSGDCFNGKAFQVTFDLTGLHLTSPDSLIWSVAYNTEHHGPSPLGTPGPYNSLNLGSSAGATVGTDVNADAAFTSSTWGGFYCDGGAGGTGTLRYDYGPGCWAGYTPAIKFVALP